MGNPYRAFLNWYHQQNIRIQIVVGIIGAFGLVLAATVGGCFNLLSALVQSGAQRGEVLPASTVVQQGSGNFQVGRDMSVAGDLNVRGSVGQVIVITPQIKDSDRVKSGVPIEAFIPVNDQVRKRVITQLEEVRKKSKIGNVVLSVELGSSDRRQVAEELGEVFEEAGFNVRAHVSRSFSQEQAPVRAICNADAQNSAVEILRSLHSILRGKISLQVVQNRNPPDELFINLFGDTNFLPDGTVVFEEAR